MTAEYRYIVARQDVHAIMDSHSGRGDYVDGPRPKETLLGPAKELVGFLEGMEEWSGK